MVRNSRAAIGWLLAAATVGGCYQPAAEQLEDIDGDGIDDATDNCRAIANTNQLDYDRDKIGDACDACSLLFGESDTDGDGVGDGCDPSTSDKNRHVFFDSFLNSTMPAQWQATGPIQFTADGVVIDTLSPLLFTRADATPPGFTFAAFIEVLQVDSQSRISVITKSTNDANYVACELAQSTSTANLEARNIIGDRSSPLAPALPTLLLEANQSYLLGFMSGGTATTCFAADGGMGSAKSTETFSPFTTAPRVGVRVEHARIRIRFAMMLAKV